MRKWNKVLQVFLLLGVILGVVSCGRVHLKTPASFTSISKDSSGLDSSSQFQTFPQNTKGPSTNSSNQDLREVAEDSSLGSEVDSLDREDNNKKTKKKGSSPLICTVNPGTMAGSGNSDEVRLKGNVICLYEGVKLKTEEAIWNQEKEIVHCLGGMDVEASRYTLRANQGEYHRLEEKILAYGQVIAEDGKKEHVFFAEELEYDQKTRDMKWVGKATFLRMGASTKGRAKTGKFHAVDSNQSIDTLYLRADTIQYNDSLKEAEAIQNVILNKGNLEVQSDYGHYNEEGEKATMTGNPWAKLGESTMKGDIMYIDLEGREVQEVRLQGNASSLYHLYDKGVYQGKNEAQGSEIRIEFERGRLQKVTIQGNANGAYWGKGKPTDGISVDP